MKYDNRYDHMIGATLHETLDLVRKDNLYSIIRTIEESQPYTMDIKLNRINLKFKKDFTISQQEKNIVTKIWVG